jgi:hypothetical protein
MRNDLKGPTGLHVVTVSHNHVHSYREFQQGVGDTGLEFRPGLEI